MKVITCSMYLCDDISFSNYLCDYFYKLFKYCKVKMIISIFGVYYFMIQFVWFVTYKLLAAKAVIGFKIKPNFTFLQYLAKKYCS